MPDIDRLALSGGPKPVRAASTAVLRPPQGLSAYEQTGALAAPSAAAPGRQARIEALGAKLAALTSGDAVLELLSQPGTKAVLGEMKTLNLEQKFFTEDHIVALCKILMELDSQNLTSLSLRRNGFGAQAAAALKLPSHITGLDLGGNGMGPQGAASLDLPHVQHLDISGNRLTDAGLSSLRLPRVRVLNLAYNELTAAALPSLQQRPLEDVNLSNNPLGAAGAQALRLHYTHTLNLEDCGIGALSDAPFGENFPELRVLQLADNALRDTDLLRFNFPKLVDLGLQRNQLTGARLAGLPALEVLDLSFNALTELRGLRTERLRVLDVSANFLTDVSVAGIRAESLQTVDASINRLTTRGAESPLFSRAQIVRLNNNEIASQGVTLKVAKEVNLSGNMLGDRGLSACTLPLAEIIDASSTGLTDAVAGTFKFPQCRELDLRENAFRRVTAASFGMTGVTIHFELDDA